MSLIDTVLTVGALAATAGLAVWALHRDALTRRQRPPAPERLTRVDHDLPEPVWVPSLDRPQWRIADFPEGIREQIEHMIRAGTPYRAIETAMREAGWPCSNSALCRYAHRLGIRRRPSPSTQPNLENPV